MLSTGCEQQYSPRSFEDFMEDAIARDGALARCNKDRDGTIDDVECSNARRAAAAAAAAASSVCAAASSRSSQSASWLRFGIASAREEQAEQRAIADAQAAAEAAYEAQWVDPKTLQSAASSSNVAAADDSRAFGPPISPADDEPG